MVEAAAVAQVTPVPVSDRRRRRRRRDEQGTRRRDETGRRRDRRVASLLSGESQLDHFLAAAASVGLAVDRVHEDATNPLAPVSILSVAVD